MHRPGRQRVIRVKVWRPCRRPILKFPMRPSAMILLAPFLPVSRTPMRARQLSDETMRAIEQELLPRLTGADSSGVRRPFAALAFSEIARADRIKSFLSPEERARLL